MRSVEEYLIPRKGRNEGMKRASYDGIVYDLDGVIYRGDVPIPGAAEAITELKAKGVRVLFATNNSRVTVEGYVGKLTSMGVPAESEEIVTSALVTAEELRRRETAGKAIVVGGEGIRVALTGVGIEVDDDPAARSSDLVVVGWDPDFDYPAMRRAAFAVRAGATFIATNDDAAFPAPDGLWPGAGAILSSIEIASGGRAEVMGKPHKPMMEACARRLDGATRVAVVGDRPETDLAGAAAMGWDAVLVLSGVTSAEDAKTVDPAPDLVIGSLADLVQYLE